eukprot:SM000050S17047  [mRNA]  locus=s50:660021:663165:+ [translate_table: standard]
MTAAAEELLRWAAARGVSGAADCGGNDGGGGAAAARPPTPTWRPRWRALRRPSRRTRSDTRRLSSPPLRLRDAEVLGSTPRPRSGHIFPLRSRRRGPAVGSLWCTTGGQAMSRRPSEAIRRVCRYLICDPCSILKLSPIRGQISTDLVLDTVLSVRQVLVVHLLHELSKGRTSAWAPYLATLPRAHTTLCTFSPADAAALQVPWAVDTAAAAAAGAQRDWLAAQPVLRDAIGARQGARKYLTLGAWLWAASTVLSRTLYVLWDEAGALCPVGDLFNYEPPGVLGGGCPPAVAKGGQWPGTEQAAVEGGDGVAEDSGDDEGWGLQLSERLTDGAFEPAVDAYCFYARRDYSEGEQVLICYGQYTNLELLEHYGFLLPDNPNDHILLSLAALEVDSPPPPPLLPLLTTGRPSFSLLAAMRSLVAQSTCGGNSRPLPSYHLAAAGLRISREGDTKVYTWLRSTCAELLSNIATTAIEDELLLQQLAHKRLTVSNSASSSGKSCHLGDLRLELAVRWRLAYKQLLSRAICHCNKRLVTLSQEIGGSQLLRVACLSSWSPNLALGEDISMTCHLLPALLCLITAARHLNSKYAAASTNSCWGCIGREDQQRLCQHITEKEDELRESQQPMSMVSSDTAVELTTLKTQNSFVAAATYSTSTPEKLGAAQWLVQCCTRASGPYKDAKLATIATADAEVVVQERCLKLA